MVKIRPGRFYGLDLCFWPKNDVVTLFERKCENEQRQQGEKRKPAITANVRTADRLQSKPVKKSCARSAMPFSLSEERADVTSEGWEY